MATRKLGYDMYVTVSTSKNMVEARQRVIDLYRKSLRLIPLFIAQYELSHPPDLMRQRIRRDFEKYKDISNLNVIDKLTYFGIIDVEEAKNIWKQTNHVDAYFSELPQEGQAVISTNEPILTPPSEDWEGNYEYIPGELEDQIQYKE